MKDTELEALLLASRAVTDSYSPFTYAVLAELPGQTAWNAPAQSRWHQLLIYLHGSSLRKAVAVAVIGLLTAFVGFSGYAYATGTNPFTLIRRLVVGQEVQVTYQDPQAHTERTFSHGSKRAYSDIAISAFAEISLIDILHFHALHSYAIPKDGTEYISDPFRPEFVAPRAGTIEKITDSEATLRLVFSMGLSKFETSQDIDERITISREYFHYYRQGKEIALPPTAIGQLVVVFQDAHLRHQQHAGVRPTPVNLYSAFALSYPLAAIKEATATQGPTSAVTDEELREITAQHDLYEPGVGASSDECGADTCPHAFAPNGQALFTGVDGGGNSGRNPDIIPYGEAVGVQTAETRQYKLRYIEGKITTIKGDRITIKTASSQQWTFQYPLDQQHSFAALNGPLKAGQLLAGGVIASVYDWDGRTFDLPYVYAISRYASPSTHQ